MPKFQVREFGIKNFFFFVNRVLVLVSLFFFYDWIKFGRVQFLRGKEGKGKRGKLNAHSCPSITGHAQ